MNALNRQQNATTIDFNWILLRFSPEINFVYVCSVESSFIRTYTNNKFMLCVRELCVGGRRVNQLCIYAYTVHGTWIMWVNECLIRIYIVLNFGFLLLNYFSFVCVFLNGNRIPILLGTGNFTGYRVFFFSYSSEINENLLNVCNFRFSSIATMLQRNHYTPKRKKSRRLLYPGFIAMVLCFFVAFFPSPIQ